jgi:DHA3 family macrolide efflux protein-like MFS transporter
LLGGFGALADVVLPTNIQHLSTNDNTGKNFSLFSTMANTGEAFTGEALSGGFAGLLMIWSSVWFSVGAGITVIGLFVTSLAYASELKSAGQYE